MAVGRYVVDKSAFEQQRHSEAADKLLKALAADGLLPAPALAIPARPAWRDAFWVKTAPIEHDRANDTHAIRAWEGSAELPPAGARLALGFLGHRSISSSIYGGGSG